MDHNEPTLLSEDMKREQERIAWEKDAEEGYKGKMYR